mmetsp:Transcript_7318/g.10464  ORF Transcript_7318/g.10464 Transcript_7318/m.10464 type:complete len:367 (+) Transcript_7318:498-1598(+)
MGKATSYYYILLCILFLQWMEILYLLNKRHDEKNSSYTTSTHFSALQTKWKDDGGYLLFNNRSDEALLADDKSSQTKSETQTKFQGVAATLMINSPKWFQRRYTAMISNILLNIPPTWAVQIFYYPKGQSQFGMDINPGMLRLIRNHHKRIILTPIPQELYEQKGPRDRKAYLTHPWMWENMVSDRVLLFSGNGVICSNSKMSFLDDHTSNFLHQFDYIGSPWRQMSGIGGEGTISFRNRQAMLHAIKFKSHDGREKDDVYFVKALLGINEQAGNQVYRVASKLETQSFGGTQNFTEESGPPLIISGTLPQLDHDLRESILALCPELKIIFPVLHNPNCFGASPNAEECSKSICALRDPLTRRGGC